MSAKKQMNKKTVDQSDSATENKHSEGKEFDEETALNANDGSGVVELKSQGQHDANQEEVRIADLEVEIATLKDQLLRALAEAENVRRRAQREREETTRYASAPLARDLLSVADNLRRAIESVSIESADPDEHLRALLTGVQLTEQELFEIFERHHITRIAPVGEKLDPHRHEAMFEIADHGKPAGTVVQVLQPGYLLSDRLLRPARVVVSKGAPVTTSGSAEPGDSETPDSSEMRPGSSVDKAV